MPNFRLSSQHLITTTSHLSKIHKGDLRIDESFPDSSIGKESACNAGDPSSISGSERSAGEGIGYSLQYSWASWVAQLVKKKICPRFGRLVFNPWVGKIPWRRKGYPLQYSDLENSMDRIVHRVAKIWTRLSDFHFQGQMRTKFSHPDGPAQASQAISSFALCQNLVRMAGQDYRFYRWGN